MSLANVAAASSRGLPVRQQAFARASDRERLTPAGLAGLKSVVTAWHLSAPEAADLLGVSSSTWDRIQAGT
jgi:hypothetical protein